MSFDFIVVIGFVMWAVLCILLFLVFLTVAYKVGEHFSYVQCNFCGESVRSSKKAQRSHVCDANTIRERSILSVFCQRANVVLHDKGPFSDQWRELLLWIENENISLDRALIIIEPQLKQYVADFVEGSIRTGGAADGLRGFYSVAAALHLTDRMYRDLCHLQKRLERELFLDGIRSGNLPRADSNFYLDPDDICHAVVPTKYIKVLKSGDVKVPGELIITRKKFIFSGETSGWELKWSKVVSVVSNNYGSVRIRASQDRGSGIYLVGDGEYVCLLMNTIMRLGRELLTEPQGLDSRYIPPPVRSLVWVRDGGRCVQCGSSYKLELDHIIPLSRGGATSENNLQLLCRSCNRTKSNKI